MVGPKKTQITTIGGFTVATALLALLIGASLFGAVTNDALSLYVVAAALVLVWLMLLGNFRMQRSFLRAIRQPGPSPEAASTPPPARVMAHEDDLDRPGFRSVIYDLDNIPDLSDPARLQWERIEARFKSMARMTGLTVVLTMILVWALFVTYIALFPAHSIPLAPYALFAVVTAVLSGYLLLSNTRSAAFLGIPLLLGLGWLALPFVEGARVLIQGGPSQNLPQFLTFIVGGLLIVALFKALGVIVRRQYRNSVKDRAASKLLFLWVFGTDAAQELFVNFGFKWQVLGPVFFLNGKGMMETDSTRTFMKMIRGEKQVVQTEQDVAQLGIEDSGVPDKYGHYRLQSVLCGDGVWKNVLDRFFVDKDLVLMSLCGYTADNKGCEFEIEKIINEVPTEKVVYLVNDNTDMAELDADLRELWNQMSSTSPNLRTNPAPVRFYKLTTPFMSELDGKFKDKDAKETAARFRRLKMLAKEGDQIIRLLCEASVQEVQ